jgi:hypothetical protein
MSSYDPECESLARYFLSAEGGKVAEKDVTSLAGAIQRAVEDWWAAQPEKEEPR